MPFETRADLQDQQTARQQLFTRLMDDYSRIGILEFMMGICILWAGACWVYGFGPWLGLAPWLLIPAALLLLWRDIRQFLLARLGYVKILPPPASFIKTSTGNWLRIAPMLFLAMTVPRIWAKASSLDWTTMPDGKFVSLMFTSLGIAIVGDHLGGRYFTALLALLLLLLMIAHKLSINIGWAFTLVGFVVVLIALVRFRRFLHANPKLEALDARD